MIQRIFVGVGAGLGAAVLFLVISKGTPLALALFLLAPLPIVIATLGFGHWTGLAAAALGTAVLAAITQPYFAFDFAVGFGLPAWWLGFDATRHGARWSVPWAAIWAIVEALTGIAFAVAMAGGFDAWLTEMSSGLVPVAQRMLEQIPPAMLAQTLNDAGLASSSTKDVATLLARGFAPVLPAILASLSVFHLVVNLWLGARIVQISNLLPRSWTNVPDSIRLPRLTIVALAAAIAAAAITDGAAAIAAGTVVAALSAAFALEGLAWLHVITRGSSARAYVLVAAYAFTALSALFLVFAALAGIIDSLWTIRGRQPRASKT